MKLILLGGASLKNKDWIEQVQDELKSNFKLIEVAGDTHHYEDIASLGKLVREFLGVIAI